jgi:predicted RNase H-like nuclease (RuvC/YqgF family)
MKEMLIEYNEKNETVKQVIAAMISSGVIRKKLTTKEKRIAELKQSLQEAKEMAENIAAGNDTYETMEEFLQRL